MRIGRAHIRGRDVYGEIDNDAFYVLIGDPFAGIQRTGEAVGLGEVSLLAPSVPRSTYLIVGGFLPSRDSTLPSGEVPWLTPKVTSVTNGDRARIEVPPFVTEPLWMETEIALVISRTVHRASRSEALDAIFGYTVFNDATAAQFQEYSRGGVTIVDLFRAKSLETFATMGPWIETDITEADLAEGRWIRGWRNGDVACEGNTALAKFMPSEIVTHLSQSVILHAGDVISMGTPQQFEATVGDEVEFEVEGIGSFRNSVVSVSLNPPRSGTGSVRG